MTENLADVIQPTYEQLRQGVPDTTLREYWTKADMTADRVRSEIQRVAENPELTEEAKRDRVQAILDRSINDTQSFYEKARQRAAAAVESTWKSSIPMPDGESYATARAKDSSEIVALQGETQRISDRISKTGLSAATGGGVKDGTDPTALVLQAEYAEGLSRGGVEGRLQSLAAIRLAEAKGVDIDGHVDDHCTVVHQRYLQESEQIDMARYSIPSGQDLGRNPYDSDHRSRRVGIYRGGNQAFNPGGGSLFPSKQRRPSWK